jgi:hypothetical protein
VLNGTLASTCARREAAAACAVPHTRARAFAAAGGDLGADQAHLRTRVPPPGQGGEVDLGEASMTVIAKEARQRLGECSPHGRRGSGADRVKQPPISRSRLKSACREGFLPVVKILNRAVA